eukprot:TRINITY_DN94887_c0_g1_i1.p1 TRINITY_DN94887_c0_g1~~TRINITY_DN94887_c0_g1_i1.p1  ORF type:complete len:185 (+),score=24.74 TRINITY_DN94887_c0_g1_i1:45-557(+)
MLGIGYLSAGQCRPSATFDAAVYRAMESMATDVEPASLLQWGHTLQNYPWKQGRQKVQKRLKDWGHWKNVYTLQQWVIAAQGVPVNATKYCSFYSRHFAITGGTSFGTPITKKDCESRISSIFINNTQQFQDLALTWVTPNAVIASEIKLQEWFYDTALLPDPSCPEPSV